MSYCVSQTKSLTSVPLRTFSMLSSRLSIHVDAILKVVLPLSLTITLLFVTLINSITSDFPSFTLIESVAKGSASVSSKYTWFVGQVMKASKGKANPVIVNQMLKDKLG